MGGREHSFLSIHLKPQIFIPLKLGEIRVNRIRFNEFFIKTPKIPFVGANWALHSNCIGGGQAQYLAPYVQTA